MTLVLLVSFRPSIAPSTVVPNEIAVFQDCCLSCSRSRSTTLLIAPDTIGQRFQLRGKFLAQLFNLQITLLKRGLLEPNAEVTLRFAGLRFLLQRLAGVEL